MRVLCHSLRLEWMLRILGIFLLAVLTSIVWPAAIVGVAIGTLWRHQTRQAVMLAILGAVGLLSAVWMTFDWLPIRSWWAPYRMASDLVTIVVLAAVAGLYAKAATEFWLGRGAAIRRRATL